MVGDVAVLADSFLLPEAATRDLLALFAGSRLSMGNAPSLSSFRLGSIWKKKKEKLFLRPIKQVILFKFVQFNTKIMR